MIKNITIAGIVLILMMVFYTQSANDSTKEIVKTNKKVQLIEEKSLFKDGNELVANGKGVIFIFESDTCPYCELLRKDFKENKEMNELANEFNIYLINREIEKDYIVGDKKKKETTTTLRMAFAAKTTPNIVIFDKHWNRIFQLPGYAHPGQMITFMKFVKGLHNGKYNTKDWQKFLKDNGVS